MVQPVPWDTGASGSHCLVLLTRTERTQRWSIMTPCGKAAGKTDSRMDIQKRKAKDSNAMPAQNVPGKNFQIFAGDLGL